MDPFKQNGEISPKPDIVKKENTDMWASSVLMKLNNSEDSDCSSNDSLNTDSTGYDCENSDRLESPCKKLKVSNNSARNSTKTPRRGHLPEESTAILKEWLFNHQSHAYPNDEQKLLLQDQTKLTLTQINNWFTNARRRLLKNNNPLEKESK